MEDTSIEAISADPGKPKKQLPKNFRKFFFVAAVILFFVAGYLIGGASNQEKIADQKRGLDERSLLWKNRFKNSKKPLNQKHSQTQRTTKTLQITTNMTMMIPTPMTTLMRTNRSIMMIVTQTLLTLKKTSWSISQIAVNAITVPLVAR